MNEETYARIINNLHDGLYFVDVNRTITFWNKAAERITGYSADEVVGRSCADNILCHVNSEGSQLCIGRCPLADTIADRSEREAEVFLHHKHGQRIPVLVRVSPLMDGQGNLIGGIEMFTDLTSVEVNRQRIKELERLALLDGLTQLANRVYLEKEINAKLQELERFSLPFGLLFMDIDHFKRFNDSYGHDVGDQVLRAVAQTFVSNSRPFDLYGRWGGEEFVGIIRNVAKADLKNLAERLRLLVAHNFLLHDGEKLQITLSVGATIAHTEDTVTSIVKRADTLLYESKERGRNRVTLD